MELGWEVYLFVRFLYIEKKIWFQGVVPAILDLVVALCNSCTCVSKENSKKIGNKGSQIVKGFMPDITLTRLVFINLIF